jgi:DMSO/TMAO reductase YedYZ heme-binding membrane subunit
MQGWIWPSTTDKPGDERQIVKDRAFAKLVVFVNSLVPLGMLIWDKSTDRLGADPANYLIRTTGLLAILFLIFSLAVTPLRRITGQNYYSLFRRMLGLYGFFYAACHLLIFVFVYKGGSVSGVIEETVTRPFILYGMIAFLLLVPLALTSTVASIKRLGAKRWKRLHKLVYVSVSLGAIHYCLSYKTLNQQPLVFAGMVAGLLLIRVAFAVIDRVRASRPVVST